MRYWEIDAFRTIAITLMVVYHTAYDLWAFYGATLDPLRGFWKLLAIVTAGLFLLLVGMSFVIAWEGKLHPLRRSLHRAGIVLAAAFLVTVATYLFDAETYVRFGILHMIGISILLLVPLRRLRAWNILFGFIILAIFWDIEPPPYATIDYYPLLPWFGLTLIGCGLGHFYVRSRRAPREISRSISILTFPGRHSLLLYLIHQPFLLLILRVIVRPVS